MVWRSMVAWCVGVMAAGVTWGDVRVLSLNMWVGGEAGGRPLEKTADVIRAARADVVGLQETRGKEVNGARPDNGRKVVEGVPGWTYVALERGCGLGTRLEVVGKTPGGLGVRLRDRDGKELYVLSVHLPAAPYQPYQFLGIHPYEKEGRISTEEEAIRAAKGARGKETAAIVAEVKEAQKSGLPVVVVGDLNEPSHLDWTEAAVRAGRCPVKVAWPATKEMEGLGLVDAYRVVKPDAAKWPGATWTPTRKADDPGERHDRIDFVFVGGARVKAAGVVGESEAFADVVVGDWPTDHRGVVAEVEVK